MRRTPFTHEVNLMPRREGLKPAVMRGKKKFWNSDMSWKVEVKGKTILKYSKGKWRDAAGNVIATEKPQTSEGDATRDGHTDRDAVTISGGDLDIATKDLIVAAWCTKIWQSHGKVSLARTLMNGEGILPFSLGSIER